MSEIALKLLDRGFVLIPGFLDVKEIEALRKDYDKGQFDQTVYTLGRATPETIDLISQKINTLLTEFDEIAEFQPSRFGGGIRTHGSFYLRWFSRGKTTNSIYLNH